MNLKLDPKEVTLALGVLGAVATYLSQHGLSLDLQSVSVLAGLIFAVLKSGVGVTKA